MLTQAIQDYLKLIYRFEAEGRRPSTNDLARGMDVAAASVTNMLKRLADLKLVTYASYRGVSLTDSGRLIALEMLRHHRLIETYLAQALGYSLDQLHDEAEHLEHHISEQFEERIDALLGYPRYDPHGDPIPSKEGLIPPRCNQALSEAALDVDWVVRRISDHSKELLRYLMHCHLVPETKLRIMDRAPFEGPLTLRIGETEVMVGYKAACYVYVEQVDRGA
ncbi:MAG TPA: metal-dependent transcriptional regulator [Rhodothermales bacterium]|nr:metal-dependent transcriptional regulator [Rhodothermales bacterium]HRR08305.1 metal-dependent transcriptional regulator [Rhodothermales bacterium]